MKGETERLENELADAKQQHQVTLEKLAAAEELAKTQSVSPTSLKPILILTLCPFPKVQNATTGEGAGRRKTTAPSHLGEASCSRRTCEDSVGTIHSQS